MIRILVIGGSGLVGSHLVEEARACGHEIAYTFRSSPVAGGVRLDLAEQSTTTALLDDFRPDWVIHSAGWTWVDGCERDPGRAMRENCEQPVQLAASCRKRGIRFAYLSTSYVFDGMGGPYREDDLPNPINVYARSKLAAEQGIQEVLTNDSLLLRTICVWGQESQRKNFVYQVFQALIEGRRMRLPSDQIGNPTWAGDIAFWALKLMANGRSGIWNLAGAHPNCTRVQWFCAIRDAFRAAQLVPTSDDHGFEAIPTNTLAQQAARPLNSGLDITKIQQAFPRETLSPAAIVGRF